MKKYLLSFAVLTMAMSLTTACSDDDDEKKEQEEGNERKSKIKVSKN